MDKNDFSKKTREILAKRAGQTCSNPTCKRPTTGPHVESQRHLDIGEASHIRGARPTSKRHEPLMAPCERSDITNGIWLCRSCGKLIDSDEKEYTVEKLYLWKQNHENSIKRAIRGAPHLAEKIHSELSLFKNESSAAQQILIDKPKYYIYLLTIELFRSKLSRIKYNTEEINNIINHRETISISDRSVFKAWFLNKIKFYTDLLILSNDLCIDLGKSWSIAQYGNSCSSILDVINSFICVYEMLIEWEIDVRRTNFPEDFEIIKPLFEEYSMFTCKEIEKIAEELQHSLLNSKNNKSTINVYLRASEKHSDIVEKFSIIWSNLRENNIR